MKSLIVFRHAKSDWSSGAEADVERPLARRGVRAAKVMGRFLALAGQVPDSVVASSAVRARRTAEIAREAGAWEGSFRVTPDLYEAPPERILEVIRAEPDATGLLLVAGHEPASSALISLLIGGGHVRIPTGVMARVDLEIDRWAEAEAGKGLLVWLVPPKLLTKGSFGFVAKALQGEEEEGEEHDDPD